jgi:hypothetical protein
MDRAADLVLAAFLWTWAGSANGTDGSGTFVLLLLPLTLLLLLILVVDFVVGLSPFYGLAVDDDDDRIAMECG